jgi:choline transporter-like protein 2/4/5
LPSLAYYWESNELNTKCCNGYFHKCLCLQGVSVTFRYHLGTIAFGSSIVAIIDTIRTLIDVIKDRMEALNLTGYGKCCLTVIKSCLSCIRCCFEFFSRYTYIMVYFFLFFSNNS